MRDDARPDEPGRVRSDADRRARSGQALLALITLIALTVAAWSAQQPPVALPADAPASAFSAARAWTHLERIAPDEPTPIGSAGGDAIRDYLVAELSALGLQTDVQRGTGAWNFGPNVAAGVVENVVAILPGTAPTGRLLLAAHYDSVFGSPGATDDKASVAAILEAARALVGGAPLRNDVVLLLTDGEEAGLLGASAFVEQHRYGADGGILLNWEGPGNAGPSALFQTSDGAAGLVAAFAEYAPYPVGDSMIPGIFHLLPNNTDLTVLAEAGFDGVTFGFADGRAYYHSPRDTVANFDQASLQQHGANLLALARGLGDDDLAQVHSDADSTYFTHFGVVVSYPQALAWPLAVAALVAVVALAVMVRRSAWTSVPRLLAGAASALLALVVAMAAAVGLWELLVAMRPGYGQMFTGDPYRPELYRWALGALAVTVVLAWFVAFRRTVGAAALATGALLWPAVFGLAMAWLVPGMSFYGALSALAAAVAGMVAVALGHGRPRLQLLAATVGAVPGVLLLVGAGRTVLQGGGIGMGAGGVLFFAMAALLVVPVLDAAVPAGGRPVRPALLPVAAAALTVALTATGMAVDRFDADHPRPSHLMYALDADSGTARWLSADADRSDWVRQYVPQAAADMPDLPLPYRARPRWSGPAISAPLPAPDLAVLGTRPDGNATVVELMVSSRRDADVLTLHIDRPVEHVRVTAGGLPDAGANPEYGGTEAWPTQLHFYDPPAEGVRVELRLADATGMRLVLGDYTAGLARLPGFRPRPADLVRSSGHDAELVVVTRRYQI